MVDYTLPIETVDGRRCVYIRQNMFGNWRVKIPNGELHTYRADGTPIDAGWPAIRNVAALDAPTR